MDYPAPPVTRTRTRPSRPPGHRPARGRRRGGFTMIELLAVIGIMMLLGALAFLGLRGIMGQQQANRTRMGLSNAASILAEYDARTSLRRQPGHMWVGTGIPPGYHAHTAADAMDIWRDADPAAASDVEGLPAPTQSVGIDEPARTASAAVLNTQVVMFMASQVPANATAIGNIAPDQVLRIPNRPESGAHDESQVPVLLDGWGNPIIFVPASGLRGIELGEPATEHVVTSVKIYTATELPDGTLAPNARPFFASAGPDGFFAGVAPDGGTYGDDNVYSFEN